MQPEKYLHFTMRPSKVLSVRCKLQIILKFTVHTVILYQNQVKVIYDFIQKEEGNKNYDILRNELKRAREKANKKYLGSIHNEITNKKERNLWSNIQGGSNMTGTSAACLHTNQSRSYLNHLVL
jgi:hypothetical protein